MSSGGGWIVRRMDGWNFHDGGANGKEFFGKIFEGESYYEKYINY